MTLAIGEVLKGRTACYHVSKVLKEPTVFQAKVVPFELSPSSQPTQLAVIKHVPAGRSMTQYNRERRCYAFDSIAKSQSIRAMIELLNHEEDAVENAHQRQCMVFEWMDSDLWQLPSNRFRSGSLLPRIVARSVLQALEVFDGEDGVHTDLNPNNVLVTEADGPSPVVKLGDLGNLMGAGPMKGRFQGLTIRAPEVWRDVGITPRADVWSLGVTLAHWMASKVIFGPSNKIIEGMTESWCIAKMIRLVGPIGDPDPAKTELVDEFALAKFLETETFVHPETGKVEKFIKLGTLREELEAVEGPIDKSCIDFIESLLVVDHSKRPTAREALKHPWLQDVDIDEID
ncbi:MAG: hypothetical protein M1837_006620 [Sclerophora amabilis]|nr:MAG: hypothetical protein M1837_006620 [Sclerophora amabilis]